MNRIVKEVIEVKNEHPGFHTLIVSVNAGGNDFIECYVGVNKDSNYWSKYPNITERDRRFQQVAQQAFKAYGSKNDFDRNVDLNELMPLDGAWLSFARSGKTYDFLYDDLFYYGAGFLINKTYKNQTEENCKEAAEIQIVRILKVLVDNKIEKSSDALEEEVWEFIEKAGYIGKEIYSWIGSKYPICGRRISKELSKLVLYEFNQKINQKIWQIHGTGIFIQADGKIYEKIRWDQDFPYNHFSSLGEAIVARSSREKLHPVDIESLEYLLGGYHSKGYWNRLVAKAKEQKLNRNERANLRSILTLLRNGLLEGKIPPEPVEKNLDEEMQPFKDYIDARVCYEEYSGECYLNKEELVVICSMPDDSGAWVDDEDGNEKFVKIKDLFVSAYKMELINAQRNNYI